MAFKSAIGAKLSTIAKALTIGIIISRMVVPIPLYADDFYKSPMDISTDGYVKFGDEEHDAGTKNGIKLNLNVNSMSSQWINIEVTLDSWKLIEERNITKFYVLANGKICDTFNVQFIIDPENKKERPTGYYTIKPASVNFIGTHVNFQVIAVEEDISTDMQYIVAWSDKSPLVKFDPLPVYDSDNDAKNSEIISLLQEILDKLEELKDMLEKMLNKISKQIETMFTPSPAAKANLDAAIENLMDKLPMSEMTDKTEMMKDLFNNTPVSPEYSKMVFGDKRDWLLIGKEFYLLDLTEMKEQVKLLRSILQAIIWIEFFIWLVFYLSPKLNI